MPIKPQQPLEGVTAVFDLDGTLVDTAPDLIAALDHLLGKLGLPPSDYDFMRPSVGAGARALIEKALASVGRELAAGESDPLVDDFIDYYSRNIAVKSRPFPGLEPELTWLRENGATLAICTNKREWLARKLMAELRLDGYFTAIVGGDTLAVRKPDPGHLLGAISAAGGSPRLAVMIGDSDADIGAARGAGVPSIGVSFGYAGDLAAPLGADRLIHRFSELRAEIGTLFDVAQNVREL